MAAGRRLSLLLASLLPPCASRLPLVSSYARRHIPGSVAACAHPLLLSCNHLERQDRRKRGKGSGVKQQAKRNEVSTHSLPLLPPLDLLPCLQPPWQQSAYQGQRERERESRPEEKISSQDGVRSCLSGKKETRVAKRRASCARMHSHAKADEDSTLMTLFTFRDDDDGESHTRQPLPRLLLSPSRNASLNGYIQRRVVLPLAHFRLLPLLLPPSLVNDVSQWMRQKLARCTSLSLTTHTHYRTQPRHAHRIASRVPASDAAADADADAVPAFQFITRTGSASDSISVYDVRRMSSSLHSRRAILLELIFHSSRHHRISLSLLLTPLSGPSTLACASSANPRSFLSSETRTSLSLSLALPLLHPSCVMASCVSSCRRAPIRLMLRMFSLFLSISEKCMKS